MRQADDYEDVNDEDDSCCLGGNGSDMVYITQQTFVVVAFTKPVEHIHFYS